MLRVANLTPIVDLDSRLNSFLVNLESKFDFPTLESPISTTLNKCFHFGKPVVGSSMKAQIQKQREGGRQAVGVLYDLVRRYRRVLFLIPAYDNAPLVEMEDVNRGEENLRLVNKTWRANENKTHLMQQSQTTKIPGLGSKTLLKMVQTKNQNNDKQVPVKEVQQFDKEGLVNVAAEPDHDTAVAIAVAEGDAGLNEPVTQSATQHETCYTQLKCKI
ncbi:RAB GTPase homolog A1G [Actinidia rufa]|uniref:RAB GTPase homolog A1G n=1 Tax=Actinidia rufa TaxID=165716 RepID=A0A7J0DIE4_9ERIC|nr:RAB GTPase homolog A1G [Actinidia rufa]